MVPWKGCLPALRGDHGQFPLLDDMQELIYCPEGLVVSWNPCHGLAYTLEQPCEEDRWAEGA